MIWRSQTASFLFFTLVSLKTGISGCGSPFLIFLYERFRVRKKFLFARVSHDYNHEYCAMRIQERLGVLAAPRRVRSTFLFARLRSAGGFYSSSRDCTHDEGEFHFARDEE